MMPDPPADMVRQARALLLQPNPDREYARMLLLEADYHLSPKRIQELLGEDARRRLLDDDPAQPAAIIGPDITDAREPVLVA